MPWHDERSNLSWAQLKWTDANKLLSQFYHHPPIIHLRALMYGEVINEVKWTARVQETKMDPTLSLPHATSWSRKVTIASSAVSRAHLCWSS